MCCKSFTLSLLVFAGVIFAGLSTLSQAAFATTPVVTVTSPTNGSTDSAPVNFIASASSPDCAKGISAMRIYTAPGVGAYTTDADSLDVDLNLGAGTYNTVVQAWDNCGGVGKTPVTITVKGETLPSPKFLYSSDYNGDAVDEYLVNASTGVITATSQVSIATPVFPSRIASDQGGFRLYVSSGAYNSSSALSGYFINRSNGTLQAVPGSAGSLTGVPTAVAVHPSGDFVYVTTTAGTSNQTNYIYAFRVQSNGSLTAVSGSPFASTYYQQQALVDKTGSYLYTAAYNAPYVEAFDINKSTGALTPMAGSPFELPLDKSGCNSQAYDMAFAQFGQRLVVPEYYCHGDIAVFTINSNGTLSNAPGSPVVDPLPDQQQPFDLQAIAVDPLNRWWYLYEYFPGELPGADLATLTANGMAERTEQECGDIVRADPSGKFVYAISSTNGGGICSAGIYQGAIVGYSVNQSNGTLTPLSGSPFPSPTADYYGEDGLVVTQ